MKIVLYTIDCPRCKVLEKKLNSLNIDFKKCTDINLMKKKEIELLPMIEVDNKLMDFKEANDWLNNFKY